MLKELLTCLWTNVHRTEHVSVRLTESIKLSDDDSRCFRNGLWTLCSIISEKASATLSESSFSSFRGRILVFPTAVLTKDCGVSTLLSMLDEADDVVTKIISSDSSDLKNQMLYDELRCCLSGGPYDFWRLLSPVIKSVCTDSLTWEAVAFLRQIFNILSKLSINRQDLLVSSYSEYYYSEQLLSVETSCQQYRDQEYWSLVTAVRSELQCVIQSFRLNPRLCKHGPGAVADPAVKDKVSKYINLGFDRRIDYLLRKEGFSGQGEFSPFPLGAGSRFSRVIFVPKTWKKLRGISAEPAELQYFQQAIYRSLEDAISGTILHRVINLRDQNGSRHLAQKGSRDGTLATIDLSSASDSVTLQLVKDIFGSSNLTRWLLATRSTHTLIEDKLVPLNKFAPMGSACCFPVECLVFAGVVLATARRRFGKRFKIGSSYRVFGDDIICPSSISQDVISNLELFGFSVNPDKSFTSGDFRESCGMDAWKGHDVTPLKLKNFSFDFDGSAPCSYENCSRFISYANSLWSRGYVKTRSFLLRKFMNCHVSLLHQTVRLSNALVFSSCDPGTIHSANADNYHLTICSLYGYGRTGFRIVDWRPHKRILGEIEESLLSEVNYFEFLLTKSEERQYSPSYDLKSFMDINNSDAPYDFKKLQMVPTFTKKDAYYFQ